MTVYIGPTFGAELAAVGITSGVSVSGDGTLLLTGLTADQEAAARQVFAAHDPMRQVQPAIPDIITDRQCFQQLAVLGKVTQDEALAAVTVGALPKAVTDGIAGLPADQQFAARMLLCGTVAFVRLHPMVPTFLGFVGLNATSDRDALWSAAALL